VFWKWAEAKRIPTEFKGEAYFKWRADGAGFHRFLCWATHEIRGETMGRAWSEVKAGSAEWSDAELVESHDYPNLSRYRYRLSPIGWIGRDGLRHEWFYEFTVDRRDPVVVAGAKPGLVMAAKSGLSATPNERYTKFLKRDVYPTDSVLDRVLRSAKVGAAAKEYPFLKRLDVSYDGLRDPNLARRGQGFWVEITLSDSLKNEERVSRLRFFVPSGLDGPCDSEGRPLEPDFLPKDTLGEVQYRGGSESGR
jgi:hypothetical protein